MKVTSSNGKIVMKKRIILISLSTPTSFNCGAASALPYHLAKYRPKDVELEIYSFNINKIGENVIRQSENELNAKITIISLPKWYCWMFRLHLLMLRVFLKYPFMAYLNLPKGIKKKIKVINPDAIWIYGEELSHIARQFPEKRCVITTPDCEAMYYYRVLRKRGSFTHLFSLLKNALMYQKYVHMVEDFPTKNVRYHLVGNEDCEFLQNINPVADAVFINHPHYDYSAKKVIRFSQPKIKILIAGRYDFYMQDKCDELFEAMVKSADDLISHFTITFLGKDWEEPVAKLQAVGFEVNNIRFAPDYIEELIKHDIQITPIGVGTGTKGKVLDAFANGLLVMGTFRALENIQVKAGESCILYNCPQEVITQLHNIVANMTDYEKIAEEGRKAILMFHGRKLVADKFFRLFEQ